MYARQKLGFLTSVVWAVKPGGWFLNADLVVAAAPEVGRRIQEIRVVGVVGDRRTEVTTRSTVLLPTVRRIGARLRGDRNVAQLLPLGIQQGDLEQRLSGPRAVAGAPPHHIVENEQR